MLDIGMGYKKNAKVKQNVFVLYISNQQKWVGHCIATGF